jgi:hypothetical protein
MRILFIKSMIMKIRKYIYMVLSIEHGMVLKTSGPMFPLAMVLKTFGSVFLLAMVFDECQILYIWTS